MAVGFSTGAALGVLHGRLATGWAFRPWSVIAIQQSTADTLLDHRATAVVARCTAGMVLASTDWR
jgi:hypothetical protein